MKNKLTIEQSAKLIEFGVSLGRASESESSGFMVDGVRGIMKVPETPIFTFADILNMLPKAINRGHLRIEHDGDLWIAKYAAMNLCNSLSFGVNLIDALYSLLVWCLMKGYVK